MILSDYKDFPHSGRIIGFDWGLRRCGVAISDENRSFVFVRPQINVKNQDELLLKIIELIDSEKPSGLVFGLPLYSDGSDSETTKLVREFVDKLSTKTDLPIIFIEENLTSSIAQEEIGRINITKIKSELDSMSARVILENAISMLKRV